MRDFVPFRTGWVGDGARRVVKVVAMVSIPLTAVPRICHDWQYEQS